MSTRHFQPQTETESTPSQPPTRTTATSAVTQPPSSRAPQTFSHRRSDKLQNLIDKYNAAISVTQSS
ncbi:hypothetical protein D8Y22_06905 [Salinadaptatus halalkaliphilus]|uniref:Uncharacterized protein n=1 Tax=Salinadaptatus halalkaliphilus TaxID=2419781 RepID=A0A4S3TMQ3_9EURY|nr:hypothetical protein D8Y22_06905 [Salinadaptatus halalkaliphilus]